MRHVDLTQITPIPGDERSHWRRFAELDVVLRGTTGNTYAATVQNLSEQGCKLALAYGDRMKRDRLVGFKLGDTHYAVGRVVWTRENVVGLSFLSPLSSTLVEQVTFASLSKRLAQARLSRDEIKDLPRPPAKIVMFEKKAPAD